MHTYRREREEGPPSFSFSFYVCTFRSLSERDEEEKKEGKDKLSSFERRNPKITFSSVGWRFIEVV